MQIIDRLKKHILVDGFHIVVDLDKSKDSKIVDVETGKEYLDCYSQFASQALGWNNDTFNSYDLSRLEKAAKFKLANSDMYSEIYADFVNEFSSICSDFKYFFFVEGGSCGVENALKAAFDWKCQVSPEWQINDGNQLDVIHLKEAFHGRTGYALSLTNTGDIKTKWYPKFPWTRIENPKITGDLFLDDANQWRTLETMELALKRGNVAAVIFETIQGEGGDNHFRTEFFKKVRKLTLKYNTLFILDEVQCGMGLTGEWWAYEHTGIKPDIICFGKKAQVCGFCCTDRIEEAKNHVFKQSGRINSTWGGNFVDMERSRLTIKAIKELNLLESADKVGKYFLDELKTLSKIYYPRGSGLMLAFTLSHRQERDTVISQLHDAGLLALKSGDSGIRFRPALTFTKSNVDEAIEIIQKVLS